MATKTSSFKQRYALVRGPLFFREAGTAGAWTPFGPSREASLELAIEKIQLISGDDGSVLDERQTAKTATFSVTLQSLSDSNLALALQSPLRETPAVDAEAFTLPALEAGQAFFLQGNVYELTVEGLIEGIDYALDKRAGIVTALKDFATEAEGTYSAETVVEMGILAGAGKVLELMYNTVAEGGTRLRIYKWAPSPAQALSFNSGSAHTELTLSGGCLSDDSVPADDVLGRFGNMTRV